MSKNRFSVGVRVGSSSRSGVTCPAGCMFPFTPLNEGGAALPAAGPGTLGEAGDDRRRVSDGKRGMTEVEERRSWDARESSVVERSRIGRALGSGSLTTGASGLGSPGMGSLEGVNSLGGEAKETMVPERPRFFAPAVGGDEELAAASFRSLGSGSPSASSAVPGRGRVSKLFGDGRSTSSFLPILASSRSCS